MRKALITGSCGLVGFACTRMLIEKGWQVTGVDNDTRATFFGKQGSTRGQLIRLLQWHDYTHVNEDIRDRAKMMNLVRALRPDFIIHAAAQPAHDLAAGRPFEDFDTNAGGTLNMLVAAKEYAPEAPFIHCSTSKVYGDNPNHPAMIDEHEKRFDYTWAWHEGIPETFQIDHCLHSVFGASKVAADIMAQEFGRYFGMPIGIFRGACLTGPYHAAVELHGYLAYIVYCAVNGKKYTVHGYKGKQVRDQIHCDDVATCFGAFYENPKAGEVYNLGAGRSNSLSILETIDMLEARGLKLDYEITEKARIGDHIVYISDISKLRAHYPKWQPVWGLDQIVDQLVDRYRLEKAEKAA